MSLEYESMLLSGLIQDPSKLNELSIDADDFDNETHYQIFKAIEHLVAANNPVDFITISEYLEDITNRKNWISVIGGFMKEMIGSPKNTGYYATKLKEESNLRKTQVIAQRLIENPKKTDEAIRALMDLNATKKKYEHTCGEAVTAAMDELDHVEGSGVKTGLTDFDNKIGSFHNSDLILIGARPAMGKTAMLLNLADRCGVPAGIISAEQGNAQLGQRLIAINGRVSAHRMRLGKVRDEEWPKITNVVKLLGHKKIWINDKPSPHIFDVQRQARKWVYQYGIRVLFLDYVQKIRGVGDSKRERVGDVAESLKNLALELQIPVVAMAQVNREVEKRPNKRPMVSDLKEAGELEQEADLIAMIYRDEVYNPATTAKGIAEIIIGKNRHGPVGMFKTVWQEEYMRFDNYTEQWPQQSSML